MPLIFVQQDITTLRVDAIVNAANERLTMGGGVCGAIFAAAGAQKLRAACDAIGFCKTGDAVITPGFALPAHYVIHAVGPVWQGGGAAEEALLSRCYDSALRLAKQNDVGSIAFPLISSGIYGFPKDIARSIAIERIGAFLRENEMEVYLAVLDRASFQLSELLSRSIRAFLEERTEPEIAFDFLQTMELPCAKVKQGRRAEAMPAPCAAPMVRRETLEDMLHRASESFSEQLLRLIDERGLTDPEVYQRANIDRRLFSKIRSNRDYRPAKNTALALAVALRLNPDQTADLLRRAGYALSPSSRADLIVEYFLREQNYDIVQINEALFAFEENLLGS